MRIDTPKKGNENPAYHKKSKATSSTLKHHIAYNRDKLCLVPVLMKDLGQCNMSYHTHDRVPTT